MGIHLLCVSTIKLRHTFIQKYRYLRKQRDVIATTSFHISTKEQNNEHVMKHVKVKVESKVQGYSSQLSDTANGSVHWSQVVTHHITHRHRLLWA